MRQRDRTSRAERSDARQVGPLRVMQDVRELVPQDSETDDEDDRDEQIPT